MRGATDTSFISIIGQFEALRLAKYVITLDADTIMGRDVAQQLVGALAHPLNRAQTDRQTGRVVRGYGLLQPRAEIAPDGVHPACGMTIGALWQKFQASAR